MRLYRLTRRHRPDRTDAARSQLQLPGVRKLRNEKKRATGREEPVARRFEVDALLEADLQVKLSYARRAQPVHAGASSHSYVLGSAVGGSADTSRRSRQVGA
jgi:hypothetical protein